MYVATAIFNQNERIRTSWLFFDTECFHKITKEANTGEQ